ncbi:MAG: hypothetical protein QUS35_08730, partial [bacterium]|nr:hypothetical protein [bacterium]
MRDGIQAPRPGVIRRRFGPGPAVDAPRNGMRRGETERRGPASDHFAFFQRFDEDVVLPAGAD